VSAEITLAGAITGLIAEKRALGYKYVSEERALARFYLEISRAQPAAGPHCATGRPCPRDDRFPCSTPEPKSSSRRLYAGHRLANQQAPARLIPE
jgi:hypothetical protein